MANTEQNGTRRLLRLPEVRRRVGLSRSEIYRRIRRKAFPSPVPLGPQCSAWDSQAIDQWIDAQIQAAAAVHS